MQRICQVNNLVIYRTNNGVYQVKSVKDNKLLYQTYSLDDAKYKCKNCTSYLKGGTGESKLIKPNDTYLKKYNKNELILCHGSSEVIEKPCYGLGEESNDYGRGFYCVYGKNKELAKEWSCSKYNENKVGYVNFYKMGMSNLRILDMDKLDIIYWITLVATCRKVVTTGINLDLLRSKYLIDISDFDCIIGWRCDDSLSKIVNYFLRGFLSAEAVREATKLGLLQEQFALKSRKAFNQIEFVNYEKVTKYDYYHKSHNDRIAKSTASVDDLMYKYRDGKYIRHYLKECQSQ